MKQPSLPTVERRLVLAIMGVNAVALFGVIATMIVTEYLPVSIRFPVVVLLILLVSSVWTSVLLRQIRVIVRQPLAEKLAAAEAIAGGDTSRRVAAGETLEFDLFAKSINRMTEQPDADPHVRWCGREVGESISPDPHPDYRGTAGSVPPFAMAFRIASAVMVARYSTMVFASVAAFFRSAIESPLMVALPAVTRWS